MSISGYSGGSVLAVCGKKSIAFCSDHRLGAQSHTIGQSGLKFHRLGPRVFVALAGLDTDNKTVLEKIKFRMKLFKLREERDMPVKAVSAMIQNLLYSRRFGGYIVHPMVGGLEEDGTPYLTGMDGIGAASITDEFACTGTAAEALLGVTESLFSPNLEPEDLFHVTAQSMMAALDRDTSSGWGCTVAVMTEDGVTTRKVSGRLD